MIPSFSDIEVYPRAYYLFLEDLLLAGGLNTLKISLIMYTLFPTHTSKVYQTQKKGICN